MHANPDGTWVTDLLIWRQPIPDRDRSTIGATRFPGHTTTILAAGSYDDMLARWEVADKRLRALGLPGYVAVRSRHDPTAITDVSYLNPYSRTPQPRRKPVTEGTPIKGDHGLKRGEPDAVAGRLALMEGDRVRVSIYGNHYTGTVTKAALKGATVRFRAANRDGSGWGGEPPERERRFGIWNTTAIGSKVIEEVRS